MTEPLDLDPAARALSALLPGIGDDRLTAPTPCPEYTVGALLTHVLGLSVAFRDAALKTGIGTEAASRPPTDADMRAPLPGDWRERIPAQLAEMAAAWRTPDAMRGRAWAGGVGMPAPVIGMVGMNELVIHGWDLARATGQDFSVEPRTVETVVDFLAASAQAPPDQRGPFGPPVAVSAGAPLLDRAVGLSGRDPAWAAPSR